MYEKNADYPRSSLLFLRQALQVLQAGRCKLELHVEDGEYLPAAGPAVRSDKMGVEFQVGKGDAVDGRDAHLVQAVQDSVVLVQHAQHRRLQALPERIALPVVIQVLALVTAELAVRPAGNNFIAALDTTQTDSEVFDGSGHGPGFGQK